MHVSSSIILWNQDNILPLFTEIENKILVLVYCIILKWSQQQSISIIINGEENHPESI